MLGARVRANQKCLAGWHNLEIQNVLDNHRTSVYIPVPDSCRMSLS